MKLQSDQGGLQLDVPIAELLATLKHAEQQLRRQLARLAQTDLSGDTGSTPKLLPQRSRKRGTTRRSSSRGGPNAYRTSTTKASPQSDDSPKSAERRLLLAAADLLEKLLDSTNTGDHSWE